MSGRPPEPAAVRAGLQPVPAHDPVEGLQLNPVPLRDLSPRQPLLEVQPHQLCPRDGPLRRPARAVQHPRRVRGGPHAGALVLFAERKLGGGGDHTGALVRGGKSHALSLKRTGEFDVTELASLADGSLLVLERSFIRSSLKLDIRLRLIPAEEIKPGARLEGETLLETGTRYTIDNFEAMALQKWDPDFGSVDRSDPGYDSPADYYGFSQDWAATDAPGYQDTDSFSKTWPRPSGGVSAPSR